jgi:hypothetical protein
MAGGGVDNKFRICRTYWDWRTGSRNHEIQTIGLASVLQHTGRPNIRADQTKEILLKVFPRSDAVGGVGKSLRETSIM